MSPVQASPYDQSRGALPPSRRTGLPSLAIFAAVPTAAEIQDAGVAGVPVAIVFAFHRMYGPKGNMRSNIVGSGPDPSYPYVWPIRDQKFNRELYVRFGGVKLGTFISESPRGSGLYPFNGTAFVDAVLDHYHAYEQPGPADFCVADPDLSRSRRMADVLQGRKSYLVRKEKSTEVEEVASATDAMWRQLPSNLPKGPWFEAMVPLASPTPASYYTDAFGFDATSLEPSNDVDGVADNQENFARIAQKVSAQLRQLNALVSVISNFGDTAALHPTYKARLKKVRIEVGGHTDRMASKSYNEALSAKRAGQVVEWACGTLGTILDYPSTVSPVPDMLSDLMVPKGYAYEECTADPGVEPSPKPVCRKISVRLVMVK
jgi:hypothetical protein